MAWRREDERRFLRAHRAVHESGATVRTLASGSPSTTHTIRPVPAALAQPAAYDRGGFPPSHRDLPRPPRATKRCMGILGAILLGFGAFEGLVFHGPYPCILKPDSSAGILETRIHNEIVRPKNDPNQIVGIGDSRMALVPRVANQLTPETGYTFGSLGTPGTTPRVWYYMLRDVDPDADRYEAIVITIDSYDDQESPEDHADRMLDLHFLVARLGLGDLREFSGSFHDPRLKWEAARGILLKGLTYKQDFQDLLLHPIARWKDVERSRRDSHIWFDGYVAPSNSLDGLRVDWETKTLTMPPGTDASREAALRRQLLEPLPADKGLHGAYMKYWLGRIYKRYRRSSTRLVFLRLPRAAWIRPDLPPPNPDSSVHRLAAEPNVTLIPEHFFDGLETPSLFQDELHLNQQGLDLFSTMLARELREILGPPR